MISGITSASAGGPTEHRHHSEWLGPRRDHNGASVPGVGDCFWCSENTCLANTKLLIAKGLCLRRRRRYSLGGFSEQERHASMNGGHRQV